jgi:hypothetical protein
LLEIMTYSDQSPLIEAKHKTLICSMVQRRGLIRKSCMRVF